MIEKEGMQLSDVIACYHIDATLVLRGYNYNVYAFAYKMMLRLIAKGIIRSYSMRQRRTAAAVKPPNGIVSDCDVCGGLIFNARRYMHVNDAYFSHSTIRFPYGLKKIFDRILYELQYLDKVHARHFTSDLDQLERIFEYRASSSCSFPVTNVELEYMFDTLGFLWLHHDSPPYLLYFLEKLVDGLSDDRVRPPHLPTATTALIGGCDWYQSIIQHGISIRYRCV